MVSRFVRQAAKKAMLPAIRLHDLRHTNANLALRAGIHPKVVSERLGHATVAITLDTYSHAIPAMQEEAAVRIAELVFAGAVGPPSASAAHVDPDRLSAAPVFQYLGGRGEENAALSFWCTLWLPHLGQTA